MINMEPTNHPFRKENDLPHLHDYVPYCSMLIFRGVYLLVPHQLKLNPMVLSTLDLKTKFLRFVWEKIADTSQQLRKFAETVKKNLVGGFKYFIFTPIPGVS